LKRWQSNVFKQKNKMGRVLSQPHLNKSKKTIVNWPWLECQVTLMNEQNHFFLTLTFGPQSHYFLRQHSIIYHRGSKHLDSGRKYYLQHLSFGFRNTRQLSFQLQHFVVTKFNMVFTNSFHTFIIRFNTILHSDFCTKYPWSTPMLLLFIKFYIS
jgi:hypothetical protein